MNISWTLRIAHSSAISVRRVRWGLYLLLVALFISTGCVRRRLVVRTNPPGASVYADKQLLGTSPAGTAFTYYGTREFEVVADGYRTEKVLHTISPPWYQIPPLDFISESLWPWELRDERVIDITMVPAEPLASEELQSKADNMRIQASQGIVTAGGPVVDTGLPNYGAPAPTVMAPQQPLPTQPQGPGWRPGQAVQDFFLPDGRAPQRIPETGILPGGGYRPPMPGE